MDIYSDAAFKKVVYSAVYALLAAALFYVSAAYMLPVVLPFLTAFCIAAALKKPVSFLSEKTRLPRALFAAVSVVLLTAAVVSVMIFSVSKALSEASRFLDQLSSGGSAAPDAVWEFIRGIAEKMPFMTVGYIDSLREGLRTAAGDFLTGLLARVPAFAASAASKIPGVMLFTLTVILSAVYMTADYGKITGFLMRRLPEKARNAILSVKRKTSRGAAGMLKAYFLIFLITFGELALGFAILGRRYVFLPALLTAAVDVLPVFGTGVVLVPLSVAGFITGDVKTGIGMLALYGAISLIRQLLEPRLIGASVGIHPLAALASMYMGFKVFGVGGMILAPIAVTLFGGALKSDPDIGAENAGAKEKKAN